VIIIIVSPCRAPKTAIIPVIQATYEIIESETFTDRSEWEERTRTLEPEHTMCINTKHEYSSNQMKITEASNLWSEERLKKRLATTWNPPGLPFDLLEVHDEKENPWKSAMP
jgi:hypothetical protein